jgi:predicted ATPase
MDDIARQMDTPGLRLDFRNQRVERRGQIIELRPKSWQLLTYMAAHPSELLGKEELVEAVWGDTVVGDASLNQVVGELRKALGDDARSPRYIETVHRRGFRFLLDTESTENTKKRSGNPTDIKHQPTLFGRSTELEGLHQLFEHSITGKMNFYFITGEAGIGKTSLAREFLEEIQRQANQTPFLVGHGQCIDQLGEGEPYLPILEALDRLARGPMGDAVLEKLECYAPLWLVQMPWLLPPGHSYDPLLVAATPARMLREFCVFLEALTAQSPIVLWLEDMHWADRATSDLLDSLARREEASRLLVIVSYRPVDAALLEAPIRHLKESLIPQHLATELELEPLSRQAVSDYLAHRFAGISELSELSELTSLMFELSDGNPLFIITLAEYLTAQDFLVHGANGWTLTQPPESIQASCPAGLKPTIELQLQQLTKTELLVLEAASVVGTQFPAQALAGVIKWELDAIESSCDLLAEQGQFLTSAGSIDWPDHSVGQCYQFIHDIYRQVLYDRLTTAHRQRLHLSTGLAIEAGYPEQVDEVSAELALHFELGHDPVRAIFHLKLAAERAQQRAAPTEAVAYLKRALAQLTRLPHSTNREETELELRLRLMRLLISTVSYTALEQEQNLTRALELASTLKDAASELLLLAQQSASLILQAKFDLLEQVIRRAKLASEFCDDMVLLSHEPLASAILALTRSELNPAEAFFRAVNKSLADADLRLPARRFGHDPMVLSLGYSAISAWMLGRPDEARKRARLGLERANAIGLPQVQANGLDTALTIEHLRRDVEQTSSLASAFTACLDKFGIKYPYPRPLSACNWLLLQSGDAAAAIAGLRQDIEKTLAARLGLFLPLIYITLAEACLAARNTSDGLAAVDDAFISIRRGQALFEPEAWRIKGELLRLTDDRSQPGECFRKAMQLAGTQSALALELRAATSLGRLQLDTGLAPDASEHLRASLGRFTEGFDTADFRDATATLKSLG